MQTQKEERFTVETIQGVKMHTGPAQEPEEQEQPRPAGIILERHHLGAVEFASADAGRYQIAGVHVRADGAVEATDGHMAIRVTASKYPGEDYPAVPGAGDKPLGADVIIPADTIKATLKALPKKSAIPILAAACLAVNANPDRPTLTTTDLETGNVRPFAPVSGQFPVLDNVIPDREAKGAVKVGINADLLRTICDYAIRYGSSRTGTHALELTIIPDKDRTVTGAMRVDITLADERGKAVVALMPCRVS